MALGKPGRILLVECARGAAALYVCFHHIAMYEQAIFIKWPKFVFYPLSFGEEMVSLFFFLSGFSIHYSSHNRPLGAAAGIRHYYYLRFRRIYPIFLIAVALTVSLGACSSMLGMASAKSVQHQGLLYVLTFLTDWHPGYWHPVLPNNVPLWSLSYEVPYYLVYPLFWMASRRWGAERAFVVSFLGSCAFIFLDCLHPNHLSNVFSLYWLWTCGALMADWRLKNRTFDVSPVAYYLLLFISYAVCQSTEALVDPVIHRNLNALTIGLIVFSPFVNFKPISLSVRLYTIACLLLLLALFHLATRHSASWGPHYFLDARLLFCAVILSSFMISGVSIASFCRGVTKPFLMAGAISYAVYVIHLPILLFVGDVLHSFNLSSLYLPVAVLIIFPLAWWLEIRFQARITLWIDAARTRFAQGRATKSVGGSKPGSK
jgi:peptidoglycan/LPS O-acetylase OafA/YrhL